MNPQTPQLNTQNVPQQPFNGGAPLSADQIQQARLRLGIDQPTSPQGAQQAQVSVSAADRMKSLGYNLDGTPLSTGDSGTTEVKRGFAGEILPTLGQIGGEAIGGIIGGLGGAVAGAGTPAEVGTIPGGVMAGKTAGGAIGGALGEFGQQSLEKLTGERQSYDIPAIGISSATGALLGPLGKITDVALDFAKPVLNPIKDFAGKAGITLLSTMSGYPKEAITTALEGAKGAVAGGFSKGEELLTDLIKKASSKIGEISSAASDAFGKRLDEIAAKESLGGAGQTASRKLQLDELGNLQQQVTNKLRSDFSIGVNKDGTLNFDREIRPSAIVNSSERKNVQQAFDAISSINKDTSVKHVEDVIEKIGALRKFDTAKGTQSSAIISDMYDRVSEGIKTLYPELYALRKEYAPTRQFINNVTSVIPQGGENIPTKKLQSSLGAIRSMFNAGKLPTRELMGTLAEKTGIELPSVAAGAKIGEQVPMKTVPDLLRAAPEIVAKQIANPESLSRMVKDFSSKYGIASNSAKSLIMDITNVLQEKGTGQTTK